MKQILIVFLLVCGSCYAASCSVSTTSKKLQPVQMRAQKAQMIAYGQVLKIFPIPPPLGAHSWRLYTAEFKLLCPIKNDLFLSIVEEQSEARKRDDQLFNVSLMGHTTGRCLNDEVETGKNYFMFIRESSYRHPDKQVVVHRFLPDQVNGQSAALLDTAENRMSLVGFTTECEQVLEAILPEEANSIKDSFKRETTAGITHSVTSSVNELREKQLGVEVEPTLVAKLRLNSNESNTTTSPNSGSTILFYILLEVASLLFSMLIYIA